MWLSRPLDDILSRPAKVAVLRAVLRVNTPLSGRELARRSGVGYGPAYQALQAPVAAGVLTNQDHGRVTTYSVRDPDGTLVAGLRDLLEREERRTRDVVPELIEAIPDARSIVLFGSEARRQAVSGSDTDLLIIVDALDEAAHDGVRDKCLGLAERHGLSLSWELVDLAQVGRWEEAGEQLWQNVMRDGVWLYGDTPEAMRLKCRLGKTTSEKPGGSGT